MVSKKFGTSIEVDGTIKAKQGTTGGEVVVLDSSGMIPADRVPAGSGSGASVTVDDALSSTSTNPVQNKVVKAALDKKVSTDGLKTINGENLVGEGNLIIGSGDIDLSDYATRDELGSKQDALESGVNIKTLNGLSLLGEGNLTLSGESGASGAAVLYTEQTLTDDEKAQARANIGGADAETLDYIANKTSGQVSNGINLVSMSGASEKGVWWYNGYHGPETGNDNTKACVAFRVDNIEPGATYNTAMYPVDTLAFNANRYAMYVDWYDDNGASAGYGGGGRQVTAPEGASYLMITFKLYNDKADAEVSFYPYISIITPPPMFPPDEEDITFRTLQTSIDKITSIIGEPAEDALLHFPDSYNLVVGDTFELFYFGVVNCPYWEGYYMLATGSKGNGYRDKFMFTPLASDVGEHPITFTLYDNKMVKLASKEVIMSVRAKAAASAASKVVLCVGDSLFNGGVIPDEFHRRVCSTDGTPAGDGLTNIKFIGTKTSDANGVPYEGYGGWSFSSYNTANVHKSFVWITASGHGKTVDDQHSVYKDSSGNSWKLETIESDRIKIIGTTMTQTLDSTSGTLTWVSGGINQGAIDYTASETAAGNPFWDESAGAVDFAAYATKQGVGSIDYVYVLLGWNNVGVNLEDYKAQATIFIANIQSSFPDCRVVLLGLQKPSMDGMGANYGTDGVYNYFNGQSHVWKLDDLYTEISSEIDNVYSIQVSGQFDTVHNMITGTRAVNVRNSETETYQTNGVHPSGKGSMQIADACYRNFMKLLQE